MMCYRRYMDTRERLVKAAAELLIDGGKEAVSTRAVASAAGVQAPTLYRLFGDKDGLLDAVAAYGFADYLATKHAMESFGYRFDTKDRSIVISGDTNPTQATIDACRGCDVLIHEVLTHDWLSRRPDFHAYAAVHHTTTSQLTELAQQAKPGLLILYHASLSWRPALDAERSPQAVLLQEMSKYPGRVVVGRDLDVY